MSLISIVIVLIIVGVLLWLIQTKIPMDSTVRQIIFWVVIIAVVVWLLQSFGLLTGIRNL